MKPTHWLIAAILALGFLSGYSIGKTIKKKHALNAQMLDTTARTELHQYETPPVRPSRFARKRSR